MIRREKARYYKMLIQENQSDPKGFWKAVKKCLPEKKGSSAKAKIPGDKFNDYKRQERDC